MLSIRSCAFLAACLPTLALAAEGNLLYNGDFELEAATSPPPGWSMWGAEAYKTPANYARDAANPHGGQACFRIHHPAETGGYIVSAPDHAIRPQRGMMYTVSFWARADKPGPSQFYFTAYQTIAPFVDAPSPGRFVINVGPGWQEYRFTTHEGWDFFADRSQYILLTFSAVTDLKQERTLWLDDIVVTEQPSTRQGRLVDEKSLQYQPLQHRLKPGDRLDFTVDPEKRIGPATRDVGGVSFHRVCGWTGQPYDRQGNYTLRPELEQAIHEMQMPMTRFYAVGDEPFGLEGSLDRAAEVVGKVGVPQDHTVLELETQGATSSLAPEVWARGVAYSVGKGYGFHQWEIANEPYIRLADSAFKTPEDYIAHVKAVSAAIRQVQPAAQIGVAICDDSQWGNYILGQTAGSYDFVVGHYYAGVSQIHRRRFEVATLTENY